MSIDSPTATREKSQPYENDLTEENEASPEEREDVAGSLKLDPVETGSEQAGIPHSMPKAGGEPDFDDEVAAEEDDDDDEDDEGEDVTS